MSDQKRKKESLSTRAQSHSQIKSASSSSSALSYVEEASENCTETSKSKIRSSGRSNRRSYSNADSIKKIVQEEGRIARNLVTWNVPLENTDKICKSAMLKTCGPSSPVKKSISSQPHSPIFRSTNIGQQKTKDGDQGKTGSRKFSDSVKVSGSSTARKSQSASSKKDIRARYWAYLFENLHRAVDEIYQTCESDESVVECKEVIMMLDQYRQDFNSLIERLHLMQDYEKGGEGSRRKNLAWEVRKRSPSKSLMMTYKKETSTPAHGKAARTLLFTGSTDGGVDASVGPRGSLDPIARSTVKDESNVIVLDNVKKSEALGGNNDASKSIFTSQQHVPATLLLSDPSNPSTWADRVRSWNKERILKDTRRSNSTTESPENDVNVAKKPDNIGDRRRNDTNDEVDTNGRANESLTENNSNGVDDGSQLLGNSLVDLPSPSRQEFDKDQEGWETVHRGGKQKQKTLWPLENSGRKGRPPSLSSKSLHSIPTVDASTPPIRPEAQLSSSSPFLFSPRSSKVILGLPPSVEREVKGIPLSIDASVFDCRPCEGDPRQAPSDRILTISNFFAKAAEPNSEAVFANCYRSPVTIYPHEGPRGSKATSPEVDDEEFNNALMDVLKEEDNLEDLLDEESEAALESAMREEKTYLWEIEREEMEDERDERALKNSDQFFVEETSGWDFIMNKYEGDLAARKDRTWGETTEEARTPGRLVHVFEKLSSPSRKRPTIESRQQLDEKQAKAAELREKTLLERGENLRMLRKKVEEIQSLKNELMNQARLRMEKKLQRAEEKRQILLQMKVKKAHEEDTKASEIAFINTLEAQNKRHEIMAKHQESEARLQDMQEERQRKHEEKAAKEAAAEERRKALEAERMSRLQEMQDRRKQRETDFEQRQQEREKERVEAARARDREREERLAALNKQQQAHIEELQKKIQQKQDETDRRHKEKLEAIQEKAFRMSLQHHSNEDNNDAPPKLAPYEKKKFCSVCNVLIPSEVYLLSHLRGKTHQQAICDSSQGAQPSQQDIEKFNLQHISDAPSDRPDPRAAREKERQKAFKKRCKKLKLRMVQRSSEYEANMSVVNKVQSLQSQHKNKMQKVVKDLQKCVDATCSGPWAQNRVSSLDRNLGEIGRIFEKNVSADKITFKSIGGLSLLFQLLEVLGHPPVEFLALIPNKSLLLLTSVLKMICLECPEICQYLLLSNRICTLIDLISQHLNVLIPDDFSAQQTGPHCKLVCDQFVGSLVELLAAVLLPFADESKLKSSTQSKSNENRKEELFACSSQAYDVVSYIVSVGILDKISVYFNNVRGSIDGDASGAEFLQNCLVLVASLIGISTPESSLVLESKKAEDPTQLILTLKATQLVGIVSLMYGILLHSDAPARGNNPPPCLPKHTLDVAFLGFRMLNRVARLNMSMFQSSLGEEGTSLEFRHIASYLLWYCNCCSNDLLLHEVILCVGYFGLLNSDNQLIIQSGQPPTILQQLCFLPFQYFSDPKLTGILFPTLICCCFKMLSNKTILEQELSCVLLSNFLEENSLKGQSSEHTNDDKLPTSVDRFKQFYGSPINRRMCLAARFPRHLWQEAQLYFSSE